VALTSIFFLELPANRTGLKNRLAAGTLDLTTRNDAK